MIRHGRKAYFYHRCRCDICRRAQADYRRDYERRRKEGEVRAERIRDLQPQFGEWIMWGEWSDRAACKGSGDWAIPDNVLYSRSQRRNAFVVRAINGCNACPVLDECSNWIFAHDIDPCRTHVVAGMTPKERNAHRRSIGIVIRGGKPRGDAA